MKAKNYAALCLVASGLNLSAAETVLHELNLPTGTNALISVEAGDTVYIDKITGKRGSITKFRKRVSDYLANDPAAHASEAEAGAAALQPRDGRFLRVAARAERT